MFESPFACRKGLFIASEIKQRYALSESRLGRIRIQLQCPVKCSYCLLAGACTIQCQSFLVISWSVGREERNCCVKCRNGVAESAQFYQSDTPVIVSGAHPGI